MSAPFWIEAPPVADGLTKASDLFVDLGEIVNQGFQPERPTVASITADKPLL